MRLALGDLCHCLCTLGSQAGCGFGEASRLDRLFGFLRAEGRQGFCLLKGRLLGAGFLGFGLGELGRRIGVAAGLIAVGNELAHFFGHCGGFLEHLIGAVAILEALGGLDQGIGGWHGGGGLFASQFCLFQAGGEGGLFHELAGGIGGCLSLPGEGSGEFGSFEGGKFGLGVLIAGVLVFDGFGDVGLLLGGALEEVFGECQIDVSDLFKFVLHVGVGGQPGLHLLEHGFRA